MKKEPITITVTETLLLDAVMSQGGVKEAAKPEWVGDEYNPWPGTRYAVITRQGH